MMYKRKNLAGFSIPEVALSVFVLSVGLMSIIALMSSSLRYSLQNNDIIVAADLAQEGIELVRNVRDNDFAAGGDGFPNQAFTTNQEHCQVDWNDRDDRLDCRNNRGAASRYYLQYTNNDMYEHVSGQPQERFSRYLYIDYIDDAAGKRATVRSFVYWGGFDPASFGATGNATGCTSNNKCVYTDTFLTAWK